MDAISPRQPRVLWSFWLACGIAVTGGIAPFLLAAGGPNRIARGALPFGVAAVALAVNALNYRRGRPLATLLYFVAGIALVYGMLSMVAVPLQLAVVGTCPSPPAACPAGSERPFSSGESNGFAIAMVMGGLAILVGFFGLWTMFRTRPKLSPTPPPTRKETTLAAPVSVGFTKSTAQPETAPEAPSPTPPQTHPAPSAPPRGRITPDLAPPPPLDPITPELAPAPISPEVAPAPKPRVKRPRKPQAELPPPVQPLELPASSSPDEPPSEAPSTS